MKISMIAALSENGIIGRDNTLPWNFPEDLKYFKKMTLGKPIIMGRNTFESIGSRPLPGRHNIILTQQADFQAPNCSVVHSREEAIALCKETEENQETKETQEIMIIGGAKIYQLFLPMATRLYLTMIHQNVVGDTYFPKLNWKEWQTISEEKQPEFSWVVLDRIKNERII